MNQLFHKLIISHIFKISQVIFQYVYNFEEIEEEMSTDF